MSRPGESAPTSPGQADRPSGDALASAFVAALFAQAPVGLACWDTEFRYQQVNEVLAAINGRSVEEHLGRRVSEVLPQLGSELQDLLAEVLATGVPKHDVRISGETPAAPGVVRHWLATYFPVLDATGVAVGVGATVVETTSERAARARATRARRSADAVDAQLRAVYSALPIGVAFVTPDLRYERVNETLAQMNGRPVEEHLGRTVYDVLGEHAAEAEKITREVIRHRQPQQIELALRTPASPHEERFFEATYFPVFASPDGADGEELLGVGAVVRDVTDNHLLQQERERLLREALAARAQAEAAQVRAEAARQETEAALADAEAQRQVADAARRRATLLATVTRRMAASLDYEATLREVVSIAVPAIADWGVVSVLEPPGRLRVLSSDHRDPARAADLVKFADLHRPGPGSSVTRAIQSGQPVVSHDVTTEQLSAVATSPESLALALHLGVRHFATWPIPSPDGTVLGALSFVLGDSGRSFSDEDLQIGQTIATRAGLHLTNARLHTERSEIARTLQASLLPRRLPDIPHLQLASSFLAAGRENTVGGDFFDVFISGDGVWTAILGDVSGKGARAAAVTATARHTLRAAALVSPDPGENVALLNRVLVSDGDPDFCTVVCARLCPAPGRLLVRLTHGGHPPAWVVHADGQVHPVTEGRGPLVGVYPHAQFDEAELQLSPDDLLLLYTDGVSEARPSEPELTERELVATLQAMPGRSAEAVAEAVKECALRLQDGPARDDIAILAIRVLPPAA